MKNKSSVLALSLIILSIIILICLCCTMFFLASTAISGTSDNNITTEILQKGDSTNKVAVIEIEGIIMSQQNSLGSGTPDMVDAILRKLDKADQDNSVKAIILNINTPGGTVYDSNAIAKKIEEVKQDKPVIALMGMSATSGGYYISAATDQIIASDTTLTGSIGVITEITDLDGLYEKLGIDIIQVTNPQSDMKTLNKINDPNSDDRKVLEAVLNDYYESFIQTILDNRDIERSKLLEIADGSIYSGKKAKELGLVDTLGQFNDAVNAAEAQAGIQDSQVVLYKTYVDPLSSLSLFVSTNLNPINTLKSKVYTEPGVYLYYLPE